MKQGSNRGTASSILAPVLDSMSDALGESMGRPGRVHVLDAHPLAVRVVRSPAQRWGLEDVEAILSDRAAGLPGKRMDAALLHDVRHALSNPQDDLFELHRALNRPGVLCLKDHDVKDDDIFAGAARSGLFEPAGKWQADLFFEEGGSKPQLFPSTYSKGGLA